MSERPGTAVEGTLPNGLRYTLWPDSRDTLTTLQVWVAAGTSDEEEGQSGIAHMLEHMMFRGTPAHPDGSFDHQVEALGLSVNAFTWHDFTAYTGSGPAEAIPALIALEGDRFTNLDIASQAFVPERDVVANERRQGVDASPEAWLGEAFYAALFRGSSYAWPTVGWAADIQAYTPGSLRAFYRRHYVGPRVHVVAVGNFDPAHFADAIEEAFAPLAAGPAETGRRVCTASFPREESHALALSSERLFMGWRAPRRSDPAFPAWLILQEMLAAAESSRLVRRLELEDRDALHVSSDLFGFRDEGALSLSIALRQGVSTDKIRGAVHQELQLLAQEGPTPDELRGARVRLRTRHAQDLAETSGRAENLGESLITMGSPWAGLEVGRTLEAVRAEDVQAVAASLAEHPAVVRIGVPR